MKRQSNHVRFICFYVVCVRVRVCVCVCVCVCVRGIVSTVFFLLMPNKRVVLGTLLIDLDLKTCSLRRPWGWNPRSGIAQSNGSSAIAHLNSCPFVRFPL